MPVDPIERLAANARRRSEHTLQKAQDAITVMAARGDAITVARLAKNAQVSRSWIYTQPELRERIEQLRSRDLPDQCCTKIWLSCSCDSTGYWSAGRTISVICAREAPSTATISDNKHPPSPFHQLVQASHRASSVSKVGGTSNPESGPWRGFL